MHFRLHTWNFFHQKLSSPQMPTLYSNKIFKGVRRSRSLHLKVMLGLIAVDVSIGKLVGFQVWDSGWCGLQTVAELCWNDVGRSASKWNSCCWRRIVGNRSALPPCHWEQQWGFGTDHTNRCQPLQIGHLIFSGKKSVDLLYGQLGFPNGSF